MQRATAPSLCLSFSVSRRVYPKTDGASEKCPRDAAYVYSHNRSRLIILSGLLFGSRSLFISISFFLSRSRSSSQPSDGSFCPSVYAARLPVFNISPGLLPLSAPNTIPRRDDSGNLQWLHGPTVMLFAHRVCRIPPLDDISFQKRIKSCSDTILNSSQIGLLNTFFIEILR